jgi:hypothetical protein
VPTRPNCSPSFLNTESSPTQVHCQRLRVASLLLEAFSGDTTPTLYRFSLSFMILSGTAHGVLLHLRG